MIATDPTTARRMIATARLLESDQPGEAFAAIAALNRLLPDGHTLAGVVEAAVTEATPLRPRAIPVAPSPAHWGQADCCLAVLDLTPWERSFLAGIRRKPRISEKQRRVLAPLYAQAVETSHGRR